MACSGLGDARNITSSRARQSAAKFSEIEFAILVSRLLIVSPVPTHPTNMGNRARVRTLLESLLDCGHDAHFMHVAYDPGDCDAMRHAWGNRYVRIAYTAQPRRGHPFVRRVARKLGVDSAFRFGVDEWYDPATDNAVDAFKTRHAIDAVIVEYVFMSRALLRFSRDTLKVLDAHDVFADRRRRYLRDGQSPKWFSCSPAEELKGLNRADVVLAIQEEEAAHFRGCTTRHVVTVGHRVELRALPRESIVPHRILAVGSDNPINVKSLEWFIAEALPLVRRQQPDAELAVAGTICNRLAHAPGVTLLGRLDDLAPAYASAAVVVNPMRFGTGLKIKRLEALGHARALVTTPSGAAGLAAGATDAFIVRADAQAMAQEIVALLADQARAEALGQAGFRFAVAYNRSVLSTLEDLFGVPAL